jgi:hypothetical protein
LRRLEEKYYKISQELRRKVMQEFANIELRLRKGVKEGDKGSLLSLFDADERFMRTEVLTDAEEDVIVRVKVGQLGEIDLKLGADIKKGKQKTIMTLFAFSERSKDFEIKSGAQANDSIPIKMFVDDSKSL